MTQKVGLLRQSHTTWSNMVNSLSRADNLEEGHFAERVWAGITFPESLDMDLHAMTKELNATALLKDTHSYERGMLYAKFD